MATDPETYTFAALVALVCLAAVAAFVYIAYQAYCARIARESRPPAPPRVDYEAQLRDINDKLQALGEDSIESLARARDAVRYGAKGE